MNFRAISPARQAGEELWQTSRITPGLKLNPHQLKVIRIKIA